MDLLKEKIAELRRARGIYEEALFNSLPASGKKLARLYQENLEVRDLVDDFMRIIATKDSDCRRDYDLETEKIYKEHLPEQEMRGLEVKFIR